jgi:hypothetical protein
MRFEMVPFRERQIPTVEIDGKIHVVMKPIVEGLGLDWSGQHARIKAHPALSKGMGLSPIPSPGGFQEMMTLDLKGFHGWLVTLTPSRIPDPDKRAVVLLYQEESFDVIADHWSGGRKANRAAGIEGAKNRIPALLSRLKRETSAEARRIIHALLAADCQVLDISPPGLEAFEKEEPDKRQLAAPFWAGIEALSDLGIFWNHARRPDRFWSIHMRSITAAFRKAGVYVALTPTLLAALKHSDSPAFVAARTVNSITGRAVHCWVFHSPKSTVH